MTMTSTGNNSMGLSGRPRIYHLVILVVVLLLLVPLLTHHYLTNKTWSNEDRLGGPSEEILHSPWVVQLKDLDQLKGQELKFRIEELLRIKYSVGLELRDLESRRQTLQSELSSISRRLEESKAETTRRRFELERLQVSLQQARVAEKEATERNTPRLGRPKPLPPLRTIPVYTIPKSKSKSATSDSPCSMDSCFDFSLCPLSSQFSFYLQPLTQNLVRRSLTKNLHDLLSRSPYLSRDNSPTRGCLFIVLVDICTPQGFTGLRKLPNWWGDGRNHLIWLTCEEDQEELKTQDLGLFGRAALLRQTAKVNNFRPNFDLISSPLDRVILMGEVWSQLQPIVPAKRKYLATYLGPEVPPDVQAELLRIQQEDPGFFVFQFSCLGRNKTTKAQEETFGPSPNKDSYTNQKLSSLCENELLRTRLLRDSTFSLLLASPNDLETLSTWDLQLRLLESLKFGAVPVLFGSRFLLPFSEVIDWSRVILHFPLPRVPELHYFLKSITDYDLLNLRRQGRLVFETYLSTMERVANTVLATVRTRIGLPPLPYKDVHWRNVFNESFTPLKLESFTLDPEDEENLGPIEPPYPSPAFPRNYSTSGVSKYELWNSFHSPFSLFPFTPWESIMPPEAKFLGSSMGFRPIGSGSGGAGKEFSESLGGNVPKEQFTVVMLTYEREQVLMNSLQRLYALPYLNRVVVVWNSPGDPSPDLKWPDIGVPVQVVRAQKNSLNNRFLPFDSIETEAVLSIDDDAHLRHDEIVFGFRVWRENRDRVVGFPGRFHAWDLSHNNWLYNSNYSCELSMVLTGAAFYHKAYSYIYTYEMPVAIREKVDDLMNCEDIAMNFLVSHLTQKPPVKVTSRWTFRCPGCPVTLSEDDSHFQERHHCINFFSKVYGYTPLFNTQFRADSILFKTRIPHDKQKCFKYI